MNRFNTGTSLFIVLLLSVLAACGGAPDAAQSSPTTSPTVNPTEEPTELTEPTAASVESDAPAPKPTAVSTAKPEPTAEPTEEPEPTAEPESVSPTEGPELILVAQPSLFPEGIEYDVANGRFLLGSIGEGTIYAINDDGTFHPFIQDNDFLSTIGLEIDVERNRLLIANTAYIFTDPTLSSQAYLGIYDLTTGARLDMINLIADDPDGDHFVNDIAVDADGNVYVTDSLAGVFKVDTEGNVTPFAAAEVGINFPNGIVYNPDGYLIVAATATGDLYKVPLDDPSSATQIGMEQAVTGDGMVWHPSGNLIVVDYGTNSVVSLRSDDGWETAVVEATSPDHPASTIAVRGEQIYAIYPHFGDLYDGTSPEAFEIVLVEFGE